MTKNWGKDVIRFCNFNVIVLTFRLRNMSRNRIKIANVSEQSDRQNLTKLRQNETKRTKIRCACTLYFSLFYFCLFEHTLRVGRQTDFSGFNRPNLSHVIATR